MQHFHLHMLLTLTQALLQITRIGRGYKMALLCVSSVLHMLANSNGNIFFWGKFPRFFVEVFHPVAQQ